MGTPPELHGWAGGAVRSGDRPGKRCGRPRARPRSPHRGADQDPVRRANAPLRPGNGILRLRGSHAATHSGHLVAVSVPPLWEHRVVPLQGDYEPSTSSWSRKQTELFEATKGEEGGDLRGRPIIVVTSVGAKTGKIRKTPLMRVEHDGVYAVVASQGGAPKHPVWYHNLKKNPHVELQDRATKRDYLAREVTGDEKTMWWDRAVEAWPDYATYQTKTDRQIPVFVLEPLE